MEIRAENLGAVKEAAAQIVGEVLATEQPKESATIVGLSGELGAGKTTFTKAVAEVLGVTETVTSPTFVIEKIYKLPKETSGITHFIHIDAYRLEDAHELEVLGWNTIVSDPHNLIFIEWPERVKAILPETLPMIRFTVINETTRTIEFSHGKK